MLKTFRGFTLVEILVIIAVLGTLSIFGGVNIPPQLQKARDAIRKSNIQRITIAIEEYHQDKGCYPVALSRCGTQFKEGDLELISSIPCDPLTNLSYIYVSEGGSCPSWYQLYGNLEYTSDKIIDRLGCRNGCGPDCQFNYGAASTNQKLNPYCQVASSPTPGPSGSTPTPIPTPPARVDQYVCAPNEACEKFEDPEKSGCPDIYPDDPTCQDQCKKRENTCHDDRGKYH